MPFIYRTPLIVRRRQAFIEWANGLADGGVVLTEELANRPQVYLLHDPQAHAPTLDEMLEEYWADIFEEELWGWMTEEASWPPDRSRAMFDLWFDVELADSVVDLAEGDPLTEEDMDIAELEAALHMCAWCEVELDEAGGRTIGFTLQNREPFAHREGRVVTLIVDAKRVVTGILTPADSEPARSGHDLLFKSCNRDCERALKAAVPRALKKALRRPM